MRSFADPGVRGDIPEVGEGDPEFADLLKRAEIDHQRRLKDSEFRAAATNDYMKKIGRAHV